MDSYFNKSQELRKRWINGNRLLLEPPILPAVVLSPGFLRQSQVQNLPSNLPSVMLYCVPQNSLLLPHIISFILWPNRSHLANNSVWKVSPSTVSFKYSAPPSCLPSVVCKPCPGIGEENLWWNMPTARNSSTSSGRMHLCAQIFWWHLGWRHIFLRASFQMS